MEMKHLKELSKMEIWWTIKILSKLLIEEGINCEHIHGELKDKSIILGIDENVECFTGYHIFIKPVQPTYSSHPILEDLYFADEIIFFGMSFGDIDYPYFQMFFKDRCDEDKYYGEFSKKRIAIFTRDIASGRDIKFQLMKMNNKKLMQMYNFNTLKFFLIPFHRLTNFRIYLIQNCSVDDVLIWWFLYLIHSCQVIFEVLS